MTRLLVTASIIFCTLSCIVMAAPKNIDKQLIQTMRNPEQVYAILLDDKLAERSSRIQLVKDVIADVTEALLSEQSFNGDFAKGCIPRYGARLIYAKGKDEVVIDLCFECDMFRVDDGSQGDF